MVVLIAILLFFSLQLDGFWSTADLPAQQAILAFCAILLIVAVLLLFRPERLPVAFQPSSPNAWRWLATYVALLELASAGVYFLAGRHFKAVGYHLHTALTASLFFLFVAGFLYLATRSTAPPSSTIASLTAIAFAADLLLAIYSFPLTPARSDMMALIAAADRQFLQGHDPYHFYSLQPPTPVFLTYLPGTWLSFLPAELLRIDLRFVTMLCCVAAIFVLWKSLRAGHRRVASLLIAVFFLAPYVQFRFEIYYAPIWLCLAAALTLFVRGRTWASTILIGIGIAMSQFVWVMFPLYLLFFLQRYGVKKAAQVLAVSLASALILIGPFLVLSESSFYYGILGHWQNTVNLRPANLSFWVMRVVGVRHLQLVQATVLALLFLWCLVKKKCATPVATLQWMSFALLLFVLLNALVWGYFFLLIGLMLLIYTLAANGWLITDEDECRLEPLHISAE